MTTFKAGQKAWNTTKHTRVSNSNKFIKTKNTVLERIEFQIDIVANKQKEALAIMQEFRRLVAPVGTIEVTKNEVTHTVQYHFQTGEMITEVQQSNGNFENYRVPFMMTLFIESDFNSPTLAVPAISAVILNYSGTLSTISGSGDGSSSGGSSDSGSGGSSSTCCPLTGAYDFYTLNRLDAQGLVLNSSGSLILSSSTSQVTVSGNFNVLGTISNVVNSVNGYSGSIQVIAGPNITINSGSGFIMITGSAASSTDLTALNAFSASINVFSQSINTFTASINAFTASQIVTNAAQTSTNATQATLNNSLNAFTASQSETNSTQSTLNSALNGFTASFSSSVSALGDTRYVLTSSYGPFTASINTFSQSVNTFTASQAITNATQATLNSALNGFTASFTSSVNSISDNRYVNNINGYSGSISVVAGPNIIINSGSGFIMITGSVGGTTFQSASASGSTYLTATPVSCSLVWVTGSTISGEGGIIVSATLGSTIDIVNDSGKTLSIYPANGGNFVGQSANGLLYMFKYSSGRFTKVSPTVWAAQMQGRNGADGSTTTVAVYQPTSFLDFVTTFGSGLQSYSNITLFGGNVIQTQTGTGQKIYNSGDHLVLSSSVGSTVTVSGNLKVTGEISSYKASVVQYVGTTYTPSGSDSGKIIELSYSAGGQINCYLPNTLEKGWNGTFVQFATGSLIHFSASAGSTIRTFNALSKSAGWNAECSIYVSSNTNGTSAVYVVGGNLI